MTAQQYRSPQPKVKSMTENPVPSILSTLRTAQATSPALIWYGPDSERVELSGKVLDNWVAKTSNFLLEELDAEPDTVVELDLPVHWKTLVWALASWQAGCSIALSADSGAAVRVTSKEPGPRTPGELVVAAALPALALSWPDPLPAEAVDYAAEVRSFADTYTGPGFSNFPAAALAGSSAEPAVPFGSLISGTGDTGTGPTARVLLAPGDAGTRRILEAALGIWASGGTVVLTGEGVPATERMLAAEKVTARLAA